MLKYTHKAMNRLPTSYCYPSERLQQERREFHSEYSHESAVQAIKNYANDMYAADVAEQEALTDRAYRIHDYMNVFAGNIMPKEALDIGMLYVIDRDADKSDIHRQRAATAHIEYLTAPHTRPGLDIYMPAILNDMRYIDAYAQHYTHDDIYIQHTNGNGNAWDKAATPARIEDMAEVASRVNIESVLLKSAVCLDALVTNAHKVILHGADPSNKDTTALDHVIEAETFYGPICEVLGFDGLAMELRSQAKQLRFIQQGNIDVVLQSHEYLHSIQGAGPREFFGCLVDGEDKMALSSAVNNPQYLLQGDLPYESVQLGEFALDLGDDRPIVGNWREKSVGSLVDKLLRDSQYTGEAPMDIFGGTVISETIDDMAVDFTRLVQRACESEKLQLQKAPSKEKAIIVQGDDEYTAQVCKYLSPEFIDENIQIIPKKGFRVAKFTCITQESRLPVELQFLTKQDRQDARRGETAHILYKFETDGNFYSKEQRKAAAQLLEGLYRRKRHMIDHAGELSANPDSIIRSQRDAQTWYMIDNLQ